MDTRMHRYIEEQTHARDLSRAFRPELWIENFALSLCVEEFAKEMRIKLFDKTNEGFVGWADRSCTSSEQLMAKLKRHLDKGDMVDVANFAMMIWNMEPDHD